MLAIDADGAARRRAQVRKTRDAFVLPGEDGHSLFAVRLLTEQAYACLTRVDALAHDDRLITDCDASIGERRAEAAYALLLATAAGIDPASTHPGSTASSTPSSTANGAAQPTPATVDGVPSPRLRAHLDITIDLPTLLGLQTTLDAGVAEIAGVGAVGVDVVRGLLADPDVAITMRRLVTDPLTGHLLDYGRKTYQVPDRLRDFITARDKTCRFPGCRRKAASCQVDHADAWSDNGETSRSNTGALCTRHHQLKTHGGWTITNSHGDGSCTWTSPQDRNYEREAQQVSAESTRATPVSAETRGRPHEVDRFQAAHPPDPAQLLDPDIPPF